MSLSFSLYGDLLGKPWREDARGPDAYDCLGLTIEIQRRRGLAVPDFVSSAAELHRQLADGGFLAGCTRLEEPDAGAVVLMRSLGTHGYHMGVMVDRFRMLHASEPAGSVVLERLSSSRWSRRTCGFYEVGS
jgi:cell wall-associated NlpC family hydrolase